MNKLVPLGDRLPAPRLGRMLDDYDRNVLEPATGATGVIGHLRLQNRAAAWRGWLRGIEALLVIGVATALCVTARAGVAPAG